MVRSSATLLLAAGLLAACGGEGVHNQGPPATAGAGGMKSPSPGSGGSAAGTTGVLHGAGTDAGGVSATAGRAGAGGAGGMASAGAPGHAGASSAGTASASAGGATVSTPEMLVPTVKAFCAAARTCCAQHPDPVHLDDCESAFGGRDQTSQALARGTVSIDATDLAKCQAAYQAAATSCEENSVLDACAGIVQGKLAEGAPCTLGVECAGPGPKVCLVTGGQNSLGVCKAVPAGKAGDACSLTCRPHEVCTFTVYGVSDSPLTPCLESEGLFCNNELLPPKCQAIYAVGAHCERDDQCGSAGYCDYAGTSTCKKRGILNEACGYCLPSLMCKDGKCQSPPLTVGSTCDGYSLGPY